jgi:hypothetical protein
MTDISIGACRARLESLGYAVTSATHPDRIIDQRRHFATRRATFHEIADHPAAVFCYPTAELGCGLPDVAERRLVLLTVTGYLLADAKQAKPVLATLEKFRLLGGPYLERPFGDRVYPLQWNGKEQIYGHRARDTFPEDDTTVRFDQATPEKYVGATVWRDGTGVSPARSVIESAQSAIVSLEGKWTGSLLETPRRNLPELFETDVSEIIAAVERARWLGRPAAVARDQQAA